MREVYGNIGLLFYILIKEAIMPYEPPPNDAESKKYYEKSEKALRNINHDSSKMHRPSIETSTPQIRPYNNRDGCPLFQLVFLGIAVVSYFL